MKAISLQPSENIMEKLETNDKDDILQGPFTHLFNNSSSIFATPTKPINKIMTLYEFQPTSLYLLTFKKTWNQQTSLKTNIITT